MTTDIPLTRGLVARVDDADLPALRPFKWHATANGYAATCLPGTRRYVYMHRLLLNAGPGDLVDHIDGDRLNNTRANLRLVTPCQNQWNRKAQANRAGYKGCGLAQAEGQVLRPHPGQRAAHLPGLLRHR